MRGVGHVRECLECREVVTAFEELDVSLEGRVFEERCQRCGGDRPGSDGGNERS